MKLTFIRHSKTTPDQKINPALWPLNGEGRELAQNLAHDENIKKIEIVYTSNQPKAVETGEIIGKLNNIENRVENDLCESTSITNDQIVDFKTAEKLYLTKEISNLNNGETVDEVEKRFSNAVEKIIADNPNIDNIGIVSHGTALSIFLSKFMGIDRYELSQKLLMPDYCVIEWENKNIIVNFTNLRISK